MNPAEARKAVVYIRTEDPTGLPGIAGSGFIVDPDGLVFTNRHVIWFENASAPSPDIIVGVPSAADPDALDYFSAAVVYAAPPDGGLDFAVLKIAARKGYGAFHTLPLAAAGKPLVLGQPVAAFGYPGVWERPTLSFNRGSVSATLAVVDGHRYWQTDTSIHPGNSGGPILDSDGRVIGIVTLRSQETVGLCLSLDETSDAITAAREREKNIHPRPGPLAPSALPQSTVLEPTASSWKITKGKAHRSLNGLAVDNKGERYWLVGDKPLPENFRLTMQFQVRQLRGHVVIDELSRYQLRSVFVVFGSDDVNSEELGSIKGYVLFAGAGGIALQREGELLARRDDITTPPVPSAMDFTLIHNHGKFTLASGREVLFTADDPNPIVGPHPFRIGGYLSALTLGRVTIEDMDHPAASRPARE